MDGHVDYDEFYTWALGKEYFRSFMQKYAYSSPMAYKQFQLKQNMNNYGSIFKKASIINEKTLKTDNGVEYLPLAQFNELFFDFRNLDSYDIRHNDYLHNAIISGMKPYWKDDEAEEDRIVFKFIYRRILRCFCGYKTVDFNRRNKVPN